MDRLEEAYEIITENNPFPSVCGRVCMHPCEEACRRNKVDEPISIAALKRYAADYINENGLFFGSPPVIKSGKKVAIVGAGPSGLAAAVKLAQAGHKVTVFEKNRKAGGMLRYGIPRYRLSDEALDEDIKRIESYGVKIETGKAVGADINLEQLKDEYDAVLVAVGLSVSREIPLEEADTKDIKGIFLAIPFLRASNTDKDVEIGRKVLVVGGGNTAMDCARTSHRKGADVTILYRRTRKEMPASDSEIEEALQEGIKIKYLASPTRIISKNGRVSSLEFEKMKLGEKDASGRRRVEAAGEEKTRLKADTVIFAVGQQADLGFLSLSLVDKGKIIFDEDTLAVTDDGVFTCGDVAKGSKSAIAAIASGNKAARVMNQFLANQNIGSDEEFIQVISDLPGEVADRVVRKKRQKTNQLEPAVRINNFKEFDKGFDKRTATKEALRCMDCGSGALVDADKCITCLTCVRVCPFGVAIIDKETDIATMPVEGCQACGACAAECPANAIDLIGYPLEEMLCQVAEVFKDKKPAGIGFICQTGKDLNYPNSELIRVKCPIRIPDDIFLSAFGAGARKVFITCHNPDSCRYIEGPDYTKRRVGYIKQILDNIGIKGANIEVFHKSQKEEILSFLKGLSPARKVNDKSTS